MDGAVHAAAERKAAVLLVDHNVEVVLAHADRAIVLDYGRQIAEGTPAAVAADPVVVRAYLGDPGDRARLRHDAERVAVQVHEEER
jgi:ABC-type branched-subunit amino acid transport system ATPase component